MTEFVYKAVSREGYKNGKIRAKTLIEAQTILGEQGLTIIDLHPYHPIDLGSFSWLNKYLHSDTVENIPTNEKILFTSQLSSMLEAGLPISDALDTFVDKLGKNKISRVASRLIQEIQSGVKLSDAMFQMPQVFSQSYLAVIRSGETSGTLSSSLSYLAAQMKKENELLSKVRSALIYPSVVVTAMIFVMGFICISIVPKIMTFAQNSGQKLPTFTYLLIDLVGYLSKYWYLFSFVGALVVVIFTYYLKTNSGSRTFNRLILKTPVLGKLVARYNQARFARMLGGFYTYGVNIMTSFEILTQSLSNPLYKDACKRVNNQLTYGLSLGDALEKEEELFPPIMVKLIKGAEKSGDLGNTLNKLAVYYEEELTIALQNLLSLIEPVLIIILGIGVLLIALLVIVPIYKMTSTIQ